MLEIEDLFVSYGHVTAVNGVTIDVPTGECRVLLGPNGAGKSSILRAVCGFASSRGSITFDGTRISGLAPDRIARLGVILVPEGRRLFPTMSVHENLQVGRSAAGGRPPVFTFDDVYDQFPAIAAMRRRQALVLSGGEQQMVAIGRALLSSPRFLLLDEPSLGLSPGLVKSVYRVLADIRSSVPILLVEQSTAAALALAKYGYVLSDGKVVLSGSADVLSDREALIASYLGHRQHLSRPTDPIVGTAAGRHEP